MKFVYAFLIISIVIIVHELGHFIIAKASGVKELSFRWVWDRDLLSLKSKELCTVLSFFYSAAPARC